MRLERVAVGDVIKARIKGRSLWGEVTEVKDGIVYFSPISPAAGWRHASAREIIGHWRKTGRHASGGDDDASAAASREQLPLPGVAQVTGRDAAPTRETSLETSPAVTSGRIRTWLGEETAEEQEARFCSVRCRRGAASRAVVVVVWR
jgi:hypothetical protein